MVTASMWSPPWITFWELKEIHGGDHIEAVTIVNSKTKQDQRVPIDCVVPQLGFISSLGAIAEWGLEIAKGEIKVTQTMATNIPGIFAASANSARPRTRQLISTHTADT